MLCAHPLLALGSITYIPNDSQPNDCTWDSLFSGPPPVRPSGVLEGMQFKLGKSMTSRSGDVCFDGSWVYYDTHSVCFVIAIPSLCSFTLSPQAESPSNATHIHRIITNKEDMATSFVILEQWNIAAQRDEHSAMPILHRDHEVTYLTTSPEVCFTHLGFSKSHDW